MNLGKWNVRINRQFVYWQKIPFVMVVLMFFKDFGWQALWIIPPSIAGAVWLAKLDTDRIHQEEAEYNFRKSESFVKLCRDVEDIKSNLAG
jgi:hypothetical protein